MKECVLFSLLSGQKYFILLSKVEKCHVRSRMFWSHFREILIFFPSDFCKSYRFQIAQEVTSSDSRTDTGGRTDRHDEYNRRLPQRMIMCLKIQHVQEKMLSHPILNLPFPRIFTAYFRHVHSQNFLPSSLRSALIYSERTERHSSFRSVQGLLYLKPLGRPDVYYPVNLQQNLYFFKFNTHNVHQFHDPNLNVSSAVPTAEVCMTAILLPFVLN